MGMPGVLEAFCFRFERNVLKHAKPNYCISLGEARHEMRRPSFAMAPVNKAKVFGIRVMTSEARLLIAVVDDDKSAGKALGRLLRAFGLKAETFVSGSEFLSGSSVFP